MPTPVSISRRGAIGILWIDNPPVNALSQAVRQGLLDGVRELDADPSVKAIVIAGAGRLFLAGADISEFGKPVQPPHLFETIDAIEANGKPVVAALHGTSMGGGLEVALGSHYRVALPAAKMGLPEVKLGLLPGAGGTQRLPRSIGVPAALDMILSGNPVGAKQARDLGLVDEIVEGDLLDRAVAYAEGLIARGAGPRRLSERSIDSASIPPDLFSKARKSVGRHAGGPMAPQACIDAVEAAVRLPFADGMKRELDLFMQCYRSPYAPALWHVFFAERAAANIPDIGADVKPRPVERVGIVGAGTMGTGIAMSFANAGIPVTLIEVNREGLDRGMVAIRGAYDSAARRGRIGAAEAEARLGRIAPTLAYADLADVDLVIEAVFETMAVKREVFAELDRVCKPGAILATNTSTLDVDQIAQATKRPQDVIGLHFFSPANIMRLLEVVRGDKTAKDVVATSMRLARGIGKVAVLARVCFGFIGNRMVEAYGAEALSLLLEGARPTQVDKALQDWGLAMGIFTMSDMAGLDVGYRIRRERDMGAERKRLQAIPDRIVEAGRHGLKTGAGFYRYAPGDRKPQVDPEVEQLIRDEAARQNVPQRKLDDAEILDRCLLQLANEGAKLLEEGIALRAGDIDTIYVNGYGFPAWRGGPMWHADAMGLTVAAEKIRNFHAAHGDRWKPAPLLEKLAREGRTFADYDKAR